MKISVILATYNWPEALKVSLLSLMRQAEAGDFEVIIADDGSRDETRAVVADMAARAPMAIHHIWHPDDGFRLAAIRNKAIHAAQGDYLIFSDGDCFMQPHFIRRHRILAEAGYFVTGKRSYLRARLTQDFLSGRREPGTDGDWQWVLRGLMNQCTRPLQFISSPLKAFRYSETNKWQKAQTCNLAVWRTHVEQVNGFDESYRGHGLEDSDFVLRLLRAGARRKLGDYGSILLHLDHPRRTGGAGNGDLFKALQASDRFRATIGLEELAKNQAA